MKESRLSGTGNAGEGSKTPFLQSEAYISQNAFFFRTISIRFPYSLYTDCLHIPRPFLYVPLFYKNCIIFF